MTYWWNAFILQEIYDRYLHKGTVKTEENESTGHPDKKSLEIGGNQPQLTNRPTNDASLNYGYSHIVYRYHHRIPKYTKS